MKNYYDLQGKVCVIVGGAGKLGTAFSSACAVAGATVVVADIDDVRGKVVVSDIQSKKGTAAYVACNATDPAAVEALVEKIYAEYGHVDAVVNASHVPSTSVKGGAHFMDVDYESFIEGLVHHVGGTFLVTRAFGKRMQKQGSGSIVLIGSMYGHFPPRFEIYEGLGMTQPAQYAIAKGGLTNFTRYLAKYFGPHGIRVNMLSPGGIDGDFSEVFKERFKQHALLDGRMLTPEEVAPTLVFLFSEVSAHMTGQNLAVDSGWTI